jgi:hypothetical protein
MEKQKCSRCLQEKNIDEFFKDLTTKSGRKYYCKECVKLTHTNLLKETPDIIKCRECKENKPYTLFDVDNTVLSGRKTVCKVCISVRERNRNSTWEGLIRKKVVASWTNHGNISKENMLSIEEATSLLVLQNYKCVHCLTLLQCIPGTIYKKNCWCASLDRINTDITGYGNGNAQWLCMSCNNGKNTMTNEEHHNKFRLRDEQIKEIQKENEYLKSEVERLSKIISQISSTT